MFTSIIWFWLVLRTMEFDVGQGFWCFVPLTFVVHKFPPKSTTGATTSSRKRKHETWCCRYMVQYLQMSHDFQSWYLPHPHNSFVLCFCHNPQLLGLWGVRDFPPWEFAGGCYYGAMGMKVTWQQQQEFLEDLRAARSLKSALWKI